MQAIQKLIRSAEPVKWLFYGDSITHGAVHTFGARDYTEHFTERVRFELKSDPRRRDQDRRQRRHDAAPAGRFRLARAAIPAARRVRDDRHE